VGGSYRYQAGTTNEIYNYQKSTMLYGGIRLNSGSYFLHPDFLSLDVGAEYNPSVGKDLFLVVPDQAEVRTMKKFDATAIIFRQKAVNLTGFVNYNDIFTNRENLSNIRSNSTNWGGSLAYTNKILPFTASYSQGKWYEKELSTGRSFNTLQQNYQAKIIKSFTTRDNNELSYYHNDFMRQDITMIAARNVSDNILLNNTINFDENRRYVFHSSVSGIRQRGSDAYQRIQADENLSVILPKNFNVTGNYDFYNFSMASQDLNQHSVHVLLGHKFQEKLFSNLNLEYYRISHTFYTERNLKAGMEVRYEQRIPKGLVSVSYAFNWQHQKKDSDPSLVEIISESHALTDGRIVLLNKPFINANSVLVKDVTGTLIYQLNFDYLLVPRNDYLEIQRVPGGQIPDNATVYVDYFAMQPGAYQYDVNYQNVTASVSLFKRLLELYARYSSQRYYNLHTAEYLTLNYFTQTVFGGRLEYGFASGGVEYENYKSTIIPYRMIRYYVLLQGSYGNKLTFSVNGDMRDYIITLDQKKQTYIDVTGKAGFAFTPKTNISVEFGYRKQIGMGIDLDLLTARGELNTTFREIIIKVGVEMYNRDYLSEATNFMGVYLRIVRNFNWYKR